MNRCGVTTNVEQENIARDFLAAEINACPPRKLVDDLVTLATSTVGVS